MPKLNLRTALRIKVAAGEVLRLKGQGFDWEPPFVPISATGGTVTDVEIDGRLWRIHDFTTSGDFVVTSVGSEGGAIEYLLVAGGGGGASASGGGAGGLRTGAATVTPQTYAVVIGAGGAPGNGSLDATNGSNSIALGLTAIGGGRGGRYNGGEAGNGGSGGGARRDGFAPGTGTVGQGHDGGAATTTNTAFPGGGGADGPGNPPSSGSQGGAGGPGASSSINGTPTTYAGGGGGASSTTGGAGGSGGGGAVGSGNPSTGTNGTNGLGGGGGAGYNGLGGQGGSGRFIVRYPLEAAA